MSSDRHRSTIASMSRRSADDRNSDAVGGGATITPDAEAEAARLRAELAATKDQLRKRDRRAERGGYSRRVTVGILIVLFAILLPVTLTVGWAHRTVLDTGTYVDTVTPIATDPAVVDAVSRRVTNEIYAELNPEQVVAGALPPKAAFLAGPIANGAKDYVQQGVTNVLNSDQFQQLWVSANQFAHSQLVAVLRGHTESLQTTNGNVVLNLVPLVNAALANLGGFVSGVVGHQVTLPAITNNEAPAEACAKIGAALSRPVPATCGQIPLFKAAKLHQAQRGVRAFDRGVIALLILTPVLFAVALWVSRRRRRTLLQLTLGGMVGLVVVRRTLLWLQDQLISTGPPENKDARSAITHGVLGGFFDLTRWFLIGGLIIVVLALLTGPYRWAVALRRHAASGGSLVVAATTGDLQKVQDSASLPWVRQHMDALRVGGLVVAVLILLTVSVNVWWLLAIAVVLALYEVGLHRLRAPEAITLPEPRTSERPPTTTPTHSA
jgi:hypothetical protein